MINLVKLFESVELINKGKVVYETYPANISGNISSPTVSLLEGATFNGNIDMTGKAFEKTGDETATPKSAEPVAEEKDTARESTAAAPRKKAAKVAKKSADAA